MMAISLAVIMLIAPVCLDNVNAEVTSTASYSNPYVYVNGTAYGLENEVGTLSIINSQGGEISPGVVFVDGNGVYSGKINVGTLSNGAYTVRVYISESGGTAVASVCTFEVSGTSGGSQITKVDITSESVDLVVGQSKSLEVNKTPSDSNSILSWSSSDKSKVVVDDTGSFIDL